jgi:hypothetical protein
MTVSLTLVEKNCVRLLHDVLNPTFESVEMCAGDEGVRIRGFDESRTMVIDAVLTPHAFEQSDSTDEESGTFAVRDLHDFTSGIIGPFEDQQSSLRFRFRKNALELSFRDEPTVVRTKQFPAQAESTFTMPRFSGLSDAARCALSEPTRLSMASSSFPDRQTELSLVISSGKLTIQAAGNDFLELPGKTSGSGATRVHRVLFSTLNPLCGAGQLLTSASVTVVNRGVAQVSLEFGDKARAVYYAAPIVGED